MKTEEKPYAVTRVPKGTRLSFQNRFLRSETEVDHSLDFEELLENAHCQSYNLDVKPASFELFPRLGVQKVKFEVVKFEDYGLNAKRISEQFEAVRLRPACFSELMIFAAAYPEIMRSIKTLIALGQTDEHFQKCQLMLRSRGTKVWQLLTRTVPKITPSFPMFEYYEEGSLLRFTEGEAGWQNFCHFLAVQLPWEFESKLIPMEITLDDYHALGWVRDHGKEELRTVVPLGTLLKGSDGSIRRLVKGDDLICEQYGAGIFSVPERGFVYYKPIFVDMQSDEAGT